MLLNHKKIKEDGVNNVPVEKVDNWSDKNRVNDRQEDGVCVGQHVHEMVEVSNDTHESTCSGHFKKSEVPHKGRSIPELIDDLVNVGQTMGYAMTGCIKNMEEIIETQGEDGVNDVPVEKVDNWSDKNRVNDGQEDGVCVGQHVHERVEVSNDTHESTCSGHFKKSKVPRKGRSIPELIDDLVNVGQTMGYVMTGCIKNMEEIIETQGVDEIHR
nr:RNA-directed DNA polymerase, eukaryota, reverse transcriptase zinc-binding domain protein [Tanacetum cinerariifolium]